MAFDLPFTAASSTISSFGSASWGRHKKMDLDRLGGACERGHEAGDVLLAHTGRQALLGALQYLLALEEERRRHVLLTAAAYVLMQELRLSAGRSDCASAQVSTLRERL